MRELTAGWRKWRRKKYDFTSHLILSYLILSYLMSFHFVYQHDTALHAFKSESPSLSILHLVSYLTSLDLLPSLSLPHSLSFYPSLSFFLLFFVTPHSALQLNGIYSPFPLLSSVSPSPLFCFSIPFPLLSSVSPSPFLSSPLLSFQ